MSLFLISFIVTQAQTTYYVDGSKSDNTGAGTNWATAKKDIQNAIALATSGSEIWVKAGTYKPTQDVTGNSAPTDPRDVVFYLKNGVKLYGGFDGTETLLTQRNWVNNVTILSGDIGTPADSTDNSYHVVLSVADDNTTIFDGFTVTNALANGTGSTVTENNGIIRYWGAGFYASSSSPTVSNCIITRNVATGEAAGFENMNGNPVISDCIISYNTSSTNRGGGMSSSHSSTTITNTITNCTFLNNASAQGGGATFNGGKHLLTNCSFIGNNVGSNQGGGIRNSGSGLTLNGCSFTGNVAGSGGGLWVYNFGGQTTIVDQCTFENNTALQGAGVYFDGDSSTINRCIIKNNTATNSGGGIYNRSNSSFTNCVITGNAAASRGGGGINNGLNTGKIANCVIINNSTTNSGGGINVTSGGIEIVNSTISNNTASTASSFGGGIFFAPNSSGKVSNSILWNNTTPLNAGDNNREELYCQNTGSFFPKPTIAYSIVRDYTLAGTINVTSGSNIITGNPMFAIASDGDGIDNTWGTADDGFQVKPGSPALDFGDNTAIPSGITTDIKGGTRIVNTTVDLGAYEGSYDCSTTKAISASICEGNSYPFKGLNLTVSGTYYDTLAGGNSTGCDSIIALTLLVRAKTSSTLDTAICSTSLPYSWNGLTFATAGSQTFHTTNAAGCDSAATLNLTVKSPTTSDTTASVCNSFTWHGVTYYNTGDKIYTTTNAAGCDSTRTLHLTIVTIANTFAKTDVGCYGSATGSIQIQVASSGYVGTPPYTYRLGTTGLINSTTNIFNNLKAGSYRLYVQDAVGCIGVAGPVIVSQPAQVTATKTITNVSCYGASDGKITISNPVGVSPFLYKFGSSGVFTAMTAPINYTGLKAGNYSVYIQDANGCSGVVSCTVGSPLKISATLAGTNLSCYGSADGKINISNVVGVSPYKYKLGTAGTLISFTPPYNVTTLAAGSYGVYIQDATGCVGAVGVVALTQPAAVPVSFIKTDITCNALGSLTLSSAGNPAAKFKINPGSSIYKTQSTYSSLAAGTYYGYAKDANGCAGRVGPIVLSPATGCFTFARMATTNADNAKQSFEVSLSPNPSRSTFALRVHSAKNGAVQIRLMDVNGKVVYTAKGLPEQAFTFGNELSNGLYMVEVRQGNEVKTVKALKIRN